MAGMPSFDNQDETTQLRFYKNLHLITSLVSERNEMLHRMENINTAIAESVLEVKPFLGWNPVARLLGMNSYQAKAFLIPLIGRINTSEEDGED